MPEPGAVWLAKARELCPESDDHHVRVWFCMTCRGIAQRLQPVSEVVADVLADADLTLTVDALNCWPPPRGRCDCVVYRRRERHRWNCALTPTWAQTIRDLDTNPWTVVLNAVWHIPEVGAR